MDPNVLEGSASVGETGGILTAATAAPLGLGYFPNPNKSSNGETLALLR